MCGVCGGISASPSSRLVTAISKCTERLAHRGPDGEAFWTDRKRGRVLRSDLPDEAGLILGHRRLSIVDIAGGDQPMWNEDGTIWVSYNGEIYNHLELRQRLEEAGHRFRTKSDTEVLVHGWEEWGEQVFERLNGIFALAIVDQHRRIVVVARDPAGVKPMYVGVDGPLTWWSSELRAAQEAGLARGPISQDALRLFLLFRFIPSPYTILDRSWKVPPGHYARIAFDEAGRAPSLIRYHSTVRSTLLPRTRDEWQEAMVEELELAIKRQLMSDVPVGSLLSGGVDSALVTQVMKAESDASPMTFSIGFRTDGLASEVRAAERAAKALDVPHKSRWVGDQEYLDAWAAAFGHIGEPIGNSGGLLIRLLCDLVRRSHKVVLTGQGADEPLGGYPRHVAERLWSFGSAAPRVSAWIADHLVGGGAGDRLARVLRADNQVDRFLEILSVMAPETVDRLAPGDTDARDLGRQIIRRWVPEGQDDSLNALLVVDARMSLADDLLIIADHFSMASSVELRVPFLDLRFLDLVSRMPSRFKVSRLGERKWLYRRAALHHLPRSLAHSLGHWRGRVGRKVGFTTPLDRWFARRDGPLNELDNRLAPAVGMGLLRPTRQGGIGDGREVGLKGLLSLYSFSSWLASSPVTR